MILVIKELMIYTNSLIVWYLYDVHDVHDVHDVKLLYERFDSPVPSEYK